MNHIALAGIIGSGKTFIADRLSAVLDINVYHEPQLEPEEWAEGILGDFYTDMKRYGFMFQMYLAYTRCEQINNVGGESGIFDRTVFEDLIFSRMLCDDGILDKREHELHKRMVKRMMKDCIKPRIVIKLKCSPQRAYDNLILRGRKEESNVPFEYLEHLDEYYTKYYDEYFNECIDAEWRKNMAIIEIDVNDPNMSADELMDNVIREVNKHFHSAGRI